jgi:hypothetical protein
MVVLEFLSSEMPDSLFYDWCLDIKIDLWICFDWCLEPKLWVFGLGRWKGGHRVCDIRINTGSLIIGILLTYLSFRKISFVKVLIGFFWICGDYELNLFVNLIFLRCWVKSNVEAEVFGNGLIYLQSICVYLLGLKTFNQNSSHKHS